MNPIVQTIILSASAVRMLPHIALYLLHKKEIDADLLKVQDRKPTVLNLIKACTREGVSAICFITAWANTVRFSSAGCCLLSVR